MMDPNKTKKVNLTVTLSLAVEVPEDTSQELMEQFVQDLGKALNSEAFREVLGNLEVRGGEVKLAETPE